MSGLKALIHAFEDAIRRSADAENAPATEAVVAAAPGLSDNEAAFAGPGSAEQIAAAEARVLSYPVDNPVDMMLKTDFILREMRKLTEQEEEFEAYADQLRADLASMFKDRGSDLGR